MTREEIQRRIREKLAAGQLPKVPPREVWGGRGSGAICSACDRPIEPSESEIEADCVDGVPRCYHVDCHHLMESERGKAPGSA